jgi:3-hydroxyacyl-[acyl-carrier-protein] dehydratase
MDWLAQLPHRKPMLLVDDIIDVQPGVSVTAIRMTSPADFFFQGHFPGQPVVPAVILIEMIAQAGGIAAASAPGGDGRARSGRLAAIGAFKFPSAAGAGSRLEIHARVAGRVGRLVKIEGDVMADGQTVAAGSLTLADVSG